MAANDEFPRGSSLFAAAGGSGTATITLPAIPGIAHVIDHISVKMASLSATQVGQNLNLTTTAYGSLDGTGMFVGGSTTVSVDTYERDVNIAAAVNDQVTLTITNAATSDVYMSMTWHDI